MVNKNPSTSIIFKFYNNKKIICFLYIKKQTNRDKLEKLNRFFILFMLFINAK